jgi:hypothetical protein
MKIIQSDEKLNIVFEIEYTDQILNSVTKMNTSC